MNTFARTLAFAGLGLAALSAPALAHAHLKSAIPAAHATVATAPTELDLKFSEALDLKFSGVTITGPDKAPVSTGAAALGAGDGATLVVPIAGPLAAGPYKVEWHALSKDGHKTRGSYDFTVKP